MECPYCEAPMVRTKWLPPPGLDSTLREYKCLNCGYLLYANTGRKLKVAKGVKL